MTDTIIIEWNRDRDQDEGYLTALVSRNGLDRVYLGISQASIDRLHRCIESARPQVWGSGGYWGGSYEIRPE